MASSSATTASACSPRSTNWRMADRSSGSSRNNVERLRSGGVDLEERVLGGRADERQRPVLDRRQERVLLRLGEAVDLVEEQDRALSGSPRRWRALSIVARTSFTPAFTADICSKARAVLPATARASVVLPVPGGPQKQHGRQRSLSTSARSGRPARRGGPARRRRRACVAAAGRRAAPGSTQLLPRGGEQVVAHQMLDSTLRYDSTAEFDDSFDQPLAIDPSPRRTPRRPAWVRHRHRAP